MKCDPTLLSLYIDGHMDGKTRESVKGHLSSCEDCAAELASLQRLDRIIVAFGAVQRPFPSETDRRIRRSVQRRRRFGGLLTFHKVTPAAFGSAMAAVLLLVSANFGLGFSNQTTTVAANEAITTRINGAQSLSLLNNRRERAFLGDRTAQQQVPGRMKVVPPTLIN